MAEFYYPVGQRLETDAAKAIDRAVDELARRVREAEAALPAPPPGTKWEARYYYRNRDDGAHVVGVEFTLVLV